MEFSRQKYWSGLPFPSPGDLPDPGIEPIFSCISDRFFNDWATREPLLRCLCNQKYITFIITCKSFLISLCYFPRYPNIWKGLLGYVGEGNCTPLQYSCLENPMDGGAWLAVVHGVTRVGHDLAASLSLFTFMHWRRKWQPTPVFLLGESQGRGSLVGCRLWGRTESDTTGAT